MSKEMILTEFQLFSLGTDGIGGWITPQTDDLVFQRLAEIQGQPLTKVQLNQLLAFGHEAPVSDDFFRYYWLENPEKHGYDVLQPLEFESSWLKETAICSLAHLKWGLWRLFTDGMLYFRNVRTAYRKLRALNKAEIQNFFAARRFETDIIKNRGPALRLKTTAKDDRYLISEMACKSYGDVPSQGE